jgi:hypothetical protein
MTPMRQWALLSRSDLLVGSFGWGPGCEVAPIVKGEPPRDAVQYVDNLVLEGSRTGLKARFLIVSKMRLG